MVLLSVYIETSSSNSNRKISGEKMHVFADDSLISESQVELNKLIKRF